MNWKTCAVVVLGCLAGWTGGVNSSACADDAAVTAERQKLDGTWAVLSYESDGKETPAENLKTNRTVLKGDKTTAFRDGKVFVEATTKIDPTKKPKTTDISYTVGELKGKTRLGIYELNGDEIKLCLSAPGDDRPKEFSAPAGSKRLLITYKRVKE